MKRAVGLQPAQRPIQGLMRQLQFGRPRLARLGQDRDSVGTFRIDVVDDPLRRALEARAFALST